MAYLIERLLVLAFLCHPPALFYLNRKCARPFGTGWIALVSFLLGWGLCFPLGIVLVADALGGEAVGFVLFMTLVCGWWITGVILLLWSPIITFVAVKSKKIKLLMRFIVVAAIVGFILLMVCAHFSNRYDWGVPGNRLINSGYTRAGFDDGTSVLMFEAENDLLKQKLLRKWGLEPMSAYPKRSHPISFAAISPMQPDWWPSSDVLDSLDGYGWVAESDGRYRSLWYDPSAQRLYAERGNW